MGKVQFIKKWKKKNLNSLFTILEHTGCRIALFFLWEADAYKETTICLQFVVMDPVGT